MGVRRPLGLLVGIAIATAGCAVRAAGLNAPTARPQPAAVWQQTASGTVTGTPVDLTTWWTALGDATLSGLIDRALLNSPDLRSAQARLRQARAQRTLSAAALNRMCSAERGPPCRRPPPT